MIGRWLARLGGRAHGMRNRAGGAPRAGGVASRLSRGSGSVSTGPGYASSPLLASKTPLWRSRLLVAAVGLAFAALLGRAVYIQAVNTDFFRKQGESRYTHTLPLQASRGRILDRNGQILAASVPAPSVWVNPREFSPTPAQRRELTRLLGMGEAELARRTRGSGTFAWLRRQVDMEVAAQIAALRIKGLHQDREFRRQYPEGESAAHVVGFTNLEERGLEGIELQYQAELIGRAGSRSVVRDRLGRTVDDFGETVAPADGRDLALSLDSKVQFFAYQRVRDAVEEHNAKAGSVVVLDARSGEVLALANYPSYVPGERRNVGGGQMRNRALTDTFEPGSTMKPFIAALALQTGRVRPETIIQTAPGRMQVTGLTISDAHPHGPLSVEQVIQKSSNVGTVKMAMQMDRREMWELYNALGLGQKPPLDFPGAASGRLRPHKTWRPIEQATMSYGYGLSVSLFQLARAYTVFARDGDLAPVSMLRVDAPVTGTPVFTPQSALAVRKMLNMAAGEGGTAPKAQSAGFSVGGKTGTAHKQEGGAYINKYRAWFVGVAPISDPRIVVAVMVDEPSNGRYYGGDVAAPIFSDVVQQTLQRLGVKADLDYKPQVVARSRAAPAVEESY